MSSDFYIKVKDGLPIRIGVATVGPNASNFDRAISIDNLDHVAARLDTRLDDANYYGGNSPKSISGLALWLRADQGVLNGSVPAEDGEPITKWEDQSGQGNHAEQTTSAKKPTYETNIVNGKPAISFDGIDDVLTHALSLSQVPQTAFAVVKMLTGGTEDYQTILRVKAIPLFARLSDSANWGTHMGVNIPSSYAITGSFKLICNVITAYNNLDLVTNGTVETKTNGSSFTNSNDMTIGNLPSGLQPFYGYLAELVVYNRTITSTERRKIERFLNLKYGLY